MDERPLVTVIIPAYNHEAYVEQAVRSVLDQTYKNIELIIVDDGSTDRTGERIRGLITSADADRVTLLSQPNSGLPNALNRGLHLATGSYVAFLASDDAYLPARIEEGVNALEGADTDIPASYSDGYIMNQQGQRVDLFSSKYVVPIGQNMYKELLVGNWIPALSVLYRRAVLIECGPFDEQCGIEDLDMLLRISMRYRRMIQITKPLFLYRWHSSNYSADRDRMEAQFEVLIRKYPDLERFQKFKLAVKSHRPIDIARHATALNVELSVRHVVRKIQREHGLVNVGYSDLARSLFGKVMRHFRRLARSSTLRVRGAEIGKGVRIDGKITIVGNPKNVILSDFTRVLGDIRLITGSDLKREQIRIGEHTTIDDGATLYSHGGELTIGRHCFIGPRVHIQAKGGVSIGDDTMIAANTSIFASNHVTDRTDVPYRSQGEKFAGVSIGRNCWLGAGCVVLDGTVIGDNCVVGACCVVRGYAPPNSTIVNRGALGKPGE